MNSPSERDSAGDKERERICNDVAQRANRLTGKKSWQAVPVGETVEATVLSEDGRLTKSVSQLSILAKDMDSRNVAIGVVIPGMERIVFEIVSPQDHVFLTAGGEIVIGLIPQTSRRSAAPVPFPPTKQEAAPAKPEAPAVSNSKRTYLAVAAGVVLVLAALAVVLANRGCEGKDGQGERKPPAKVVPKDGRPGK